MKQIIADHIKPFLIANNQLFYKHPINGEIYSMLENTESAYDLDSGMPLAARWLCNEDTFNHYRKLFVGAEL